MGTETTIKSAGECAERVAAGIEFIRRMFGEVGLERIRIAMRQGRFNITDGTECALALAGDKRYPNFEQSLQEIQLVAGDIDGDDQWLREHGLDTFDGQDRLTLTQAWRAALLNLTHCEICGQSLADGSSTPTETTNIV